MKILHVVGSRSGFLRLAPIARALGRAGVDRQLTAYAGSLQELVPRDRLLDELDLSPPDYVLGASDGSAALQTGRALIALEPIVAREQPDWILAVGEVDAALAAALVGRKSGTPVAHLEAGLRTGDDTASEEINRILTDRLSDLLFTAQAAAGRNLRREGIPGDRIHFVGNVVADVVDRLHARAAGLSLPATMGLEPRDYVLALIRGEHNVGNPDRLEGVLRALDDAALETGRATLFIMEPRVARNIRRADLEALLPPLVTIESVTYVELFGLLANAAAVVTDGEEVQDCATLLGVPCVVPGRRPRRKGPTPQGPSLMLIGEPDGLVDAVRASLRCEHRPHRPPLWDGRAAERIAEVVLARIPQQVY